MDTQTKLKPHYNCTVELLVDVHTRGGQKLRKGVKMIVTCTHGEYMLRVRVRGRSHYLRLLKKDHKRYFKIIKAAPEGREQGSYGY